MKLNLSPDEFADFCILFLLDNMTNKDMIVKTSNENFKLVTNKLASQGFRSIFMNYFFSVDPALRQRYRVMREIFAKKTTTAQTLYITQDYNYLKKLKTSKDKDKKNKDGIVATLKKTIKMAVNLALTSITGNINASANVNQQKLDMLTEKIIKILEKEGDI